MTRQRFVATIYRVGQLRYVDVPLAVSERYGSRRRVAVRIRVGGAEAQGALVPRREGGHRLYLPAVLRKPAGLEAGDPADVIVWLDEQAGEPALPPDLRDALERAPGAMEALYSRTPADRRQLVRWIEAPKSADARRHRVDKAVQMVLRPPPPRRGRSSGKRRH